LIELAVVLFIISLMLGGLLVPLATQIEIESRRDTEDKLEEIKEALIGFAIINGRFPCPTTTANPANALYGFEDAACNPAGASPAGSIDGILPWKTLGIDEYDAWGRRRNATGDAWIGYWRYRVHRDFSNVGALFTLATDPTLVTGPEILAVQDNAGNSLTPATEPPVAIIYSTGVNQTEDGENGDYEATNGLYEENAEIENVFDDITIWISRPILYNRMVTAGMLP